MRAKVPKSGSTESTESSENHSTLCLVRHSLPVDLDIGARKGAAQQPVASGILLAAQRQFIVIRAAMIDLTRPYAGHAGAAGSASAVGRKRDPGTVGGFQDRLTVLNVEGPAVMGEVYAVHGYISARFRAAGQFVAEDAHIHAIDIVLQLT